MFYQHLFLFPFVNFCLQMATTIAPMVYTSSIAPPVVYGVTQAPYAAPAGPVYASAPESVRLTPMMVMPDSLLVEEDIGESGLTKLLKKAMIALPLAIVLPIAIPLIFVIKYLISGGAYAGNIPFFGAATEAPILQQTTPFFTTGMPTTTVPPYNGPQGFYTGPGSGGYGGGPQIPQNDQNWSQRKRRDADASSSGLPSMSLAQVERLTKVVFAAMRSQECIQRLLCEVGSMSKSFSDTAHSVAVAVESFVPESIKASYDVFAKAENCEQYVCGSLKVKK